MADLMDYNEEEGYDNEEATERSDGRGSAVTGARGAGGKKEDDHLCKMFVGGLDPRTTKETLQAHFEKYGKISDVFIVIDPETMNSRGYGFITFEDSNMVEKALDQLTHNIYGKDVTIKRALPRGQNPKNKSESPMPKKLFVGGIKELSESELREAFSPYGDIVRISIPIDRETENKRGFAFIEFSDSKAAKKASSQGTLLIGDTEVSVQKPKDKSEFDGGEEGYGDGYGGYRGRGGFRSRGGFGNRLGFGSQGGFGSQLGFGSRGGYGARGGYAQESSFGRGRGGYGQASFYEDLGDYEVDPYSHDDYAADLYGSSLMDSYEADLLYEEAALYGRARGAARGGPFGMRAAVALDEMMDYDEYSVGPIGSFGRGRGARVAPYSGSGGAYRGAAAAYGRGAAAAHSRGAATAYGRGAAAAYGRGAAAAYGRGAAAAYGRGAAATKYSRGAARPATEYSVDDASEYGRRAAAAYSRRAATEYGIGAAAGYGRGAAAGYGRGAATGYSRGAATGLSRGAATGYPRGALRADYY